MVHDISSEILGNVSHSSVCFRIGEKSPLFHGQGAKARENLSTN